MAHDSKYGITTYVSSESKRRAPGDSCRKLVLKEGFDWGVAELKLRFDNVKLQAEALGNREVLDWVIARGLTLDGDIVKARSGLELRENIWKDHVRQTILREAQHVQHKENASHVPANEINFLNEH